MHHRLAIGLVALVFMAAGCIQPAPPPSDRATIPAVQAPSTVSKNVPFNADVFAENLGSPDYEVTWVPGQSSDIQLQRLSCNPPNGPSPDTPACEYDANTTTVRSITESEYQLVWSGAKGGHFTLQFCAASFTNPPDPFPTGGSCVTKNITVSS